MRNDDERKFCLIIKNHLKMDRKRIKELLPDELLQALGVSQKELLGNGRTRRLCDARAMTAAALAQLKRLTQVEIAALMGVSQPGVSKMKRRHESLLRFHAGYRQQWENIIKEINNHQNKNNHEI